jgi:hypothetical protein
MLQEFSTVSFAASFPQILWSSQRSYLPIQPFFRPHAVWYVSYQSLTVFDTLILTSVYLIWKWSSRRVWPVDRGCLLLLPTWSHFWYIQRSVYAHSLICISYRTYEIDYCSLFLSFQLKVVYLLRTKTCGRFCTYFPIFSHNDIK